GSGGDLVGLATGRGQQPDRRLGIVLGHAVGGPLGHEQQVAVGGELRGGLTGQSAGEPVSGCDAGGVHLPEGGQVLGLVLVQCGDRDGEPVAGGAERQGGDPGQGDVGVQVVERSGARGCLV